MQTVEEWKKNKGSMTTTSVSGIQPVSEWKKNRPLTPKEPTTIDKIKNYAQASADTVDTLGNAILHPIQTIKKIPDLFVKPIMEAEKKAGEGLATMFNNYGMAKTTTAEKVAGTANLITGLAESAFSPVTGLFQIAENTPGLKQVADTINIPFTVAGAAGMWSGGKIVDWIPDSIASKEAKDTLREPLRGLGGLAFQVLLGGKIMEKVGSMTAKGEAITPEVAKKIKVESLDEANTIALNTPGTRYEQYRKEMGYEPYTPESQLPTIEMGAKARETMPTIQMGENKINTGSFKYEPVKTEVPVPEKVMSVKEWKSEGKPTLQSDISRTSLKVQEQAKAQGIDVPTSELSRIKEMKIADENLKASELITRDKQKALNIIKNDTTADTPRAGSIFGELKKKALAEGDATTILELAKSKVGTEAAQTLKAFDDGVRLEADPVQVIRDLKVINEKKALRNMPKGTTIEKVVKQEKAKLPKIEKVKSSVWNDFITNLTC